MNLTSLKNTRLAVLKIEMKKGSIAPNANEKSVELHRQIIEALKQKDQKKAVRLMETHINYALVYFKQIVENKER